MVKGQLGVLAAVLSILLTAGTYLLVRSDGDRKAELKTRLSTERAFQAVRTVLRKDGDTAKAVAQHFAPQTASYFKALKQYETVAAAEFAKAASGMEEGWAPDFVGLVNTKRVVVWSHVQTAAAKPGTAPGFATNRLFEAKFADPLFTGKDVRPAVGALPFGDSLAEPMKGVTVGLFGAEKAVVGALVLAWKGRTDDRELRTKAEQYRDKVDVLSVLGTRPKLDRHLATMLVHEIPEAARKDFGIQTAFVGLVDPRGVLVQRNDHSGLFVGQPLAPKSLALQTARAQHRATTEAWLKAAVQDVKTASERGEELRPEILRVGFAPVLGESGAFAGVLVVAWELGDVHASRMKLLAGAEVAYLQGKSLSSSTLKRAKAATLATVPRTKLGPGEWKAPALRRLTIQDGAYFGAAGTIPESGSDDFAFVVMTSLESARAPFNYSKVMVLILGAIMVLGFLLVGWLLRRYFILPLSELERGVADIVAGNMEHTFGVPSRETEGLAYSLNVLMSQLLGRPEPGEEEEESETGEPTGAGMHFSLGPLPDRPYRPGDSQLIPRLDETRDAHFARLYKEYVAAAQQAGEDTSAFDAKAFRQKLEVNERMICARLKCSEVRFSVSVGEEGVVLQPYPVA